ncbi:MAG: hypothetical protein FWE78_03665 [Methanimicrococcus sp.]|nr:hypothetical protein [Methanimicrococcus sp.]
MDDWEDFCDDNSGLFMNDEESFKDHSWEIIDSKTAIKETDKSFFRYRGSSIPIGIRSFFDVENLKHGEKKYFSLFYNETEYSAYIIRESTDHGRTRVFWLIELAKEFDLFYRYFDDAEDMPRAKFVKIDKGYILSFTNSEAEILMDKEEIKTHEEIRRKYGTPRTPAEALEILNKISEDMVNQPIGYRMNWGKTLSRNPSFAKLVKERFGYVCQICGCPGFQKKNGGLYAEAHHNGELSKTRIDSPFEMICLCATCHRIVHHGTDEELFKRKQLKEMHSQHHI